MKLNEAFNARAEKKLEALCKKIERGLRPEGYRTPDYTVECTAHDETSIIVLVQVNYFISGDDERIFDEYVKHVTQLVERIADPTRIVDNSHFGGHNTSLIKRGKLIDADVLLSNVELILKFPVNRF